jgi:hypothetical protein
MGPRATLLCVLWMVRRSHFYVFLPALTLFVLRRTQLLSPPNHVMSAMRLCSFSRRFVAQRRASHTQNRFLYKAVVMIRHAKHPEIDYARSGTFANLARGSMEGKLLAKQK